MSAVLGFDFGERRIGIAAGTRELGVATGAGTIHYTSRRELRDRLEALVAEYGPEFFVVGYPRTLAGEAGERCRAVETFARRLTGWFGRPAVFYDERFSSAEADRVRLAAGGRARSREEKARIDEAAAVLILQGWFDSSGEPGSSTTGEGARR